MKALTQAALPVATTDSMFSIEVYQLSVTSMWSLFLNAVSLQNNFSTGYDVADTFANPRSFTSKFMH
jgi:hypothetical protein